MTTSYIPVAEVTRGDFVESIHHAAAAVVDHKGELIAQLGSADYVIYARSSLKPFQALAAVQRGFPDRFGLTDRHLALACASHSAEDRHLETAREMLDAIGVTVDDLGCGAQIPLLYSYSNQAVPPKESFTPLHNNCSGKHLGMLALAKLLDSPTVNYLEYDSPVQTVIREQIFAALELEPNGVPAAIDGCSVPNYAVPLHALARGFARLAASVGPDPAWNGDLGAASARIVSAMRTHPEMISGDGRFDLELARGTNGRVFSKAGGEAVECLGIPERNWGIAVKIIDGHHRALGALVVWILNELGLLSDSELQALDTYVHPVLRNHRGWQIGTIRMIGQLNWLKR
jgi:L-asparaginase II